MYLALLLAPALAQTPIHCCDDPQVEGVVRAAADVAQALDEDPDHADDAFQALFRAAAAPSGLPEAEREVFGQLRSAARAAPRRKDPRQSLAYVSRYAVWLALRHEGGDLVLAEAWCEGKGGWLQTDLDTVHSPWSGCGAWR